jgi:chromosome segregation ATPase
MDSNLLQTIGIPTLVTGIVGAITLIIQARLNHRRMEAEAGKVDSDSRKTDTEVAASIRDSLAAHIERLQTQSGVLAQSIDTWREKYMEVSQILVDTKLALENAVNALGTTQQALGMVREQYDLAITEQQRLSTEIKELHSELHTLQSKIDKATTEITHAQAEIAALRKRGGKGAST